MFILLILVELELIGQKLIYYNNKLTMLPGIKKEIIDWVDISTIEWNDSIQFIDNKNYVWSFLSDIYYLLKNENRDTILSTAVIFDDDRTIYDLNWNTFLIKYSNEWIRDIDVRLFRENYKEDGIYAKLLDWDNHFPFVWTYFNYSESCYIIIDWNNKLNNTINKYVYKWVIINPLDYKIINK